MKPTSYYIWAEEIRSGDLLDLGDGEVFDVFFTTGPYYKRYNRFEDGVEDPKGSTRILITLYDGDMNHRHVSALSTHRAFLQPDDERIKRLFNKKNI